MVVCLGTEERHKGVEVGGGGGVYERYLLDLMVKKKA